MKNLRLVAACSVLGFTAQAGAATLAFTGTFEGYTVVGVGVPLTGVNTSLASWPAYDSNLSTAGVQPLSFTVSGTIDVTGGVVTGAVINQTSTLFNDYAGGSGATAGAFDGLSWTYTGGTTMGFTPGSPAGVTGTCTTISGSGSTGCAGALTALQSGVNSVWDWQGIAPNFQVSDIFGGSNLFFVDVGGAAGHAGIAWTVNGDTITGLATRGLPGNPGTFNSAYQGTYNLQTTVVPLPAGVWLLGSAIGLLGCRVRRIIA